MILNPDDPQGDMDIESDEGRIEREVAEVIELMKVDFPLIADYNAIDGTDLFEILDAEDNRLATITASQLTAYWNRMEGF